MTNTTSTPSPQTQGFTEAFVAARKKRNLSVDEVAQELNILKRHVEAIESGNYEALPQQAFARGFVINYAKLVGLDSEEMVKQFEAGYPSHLKEDKIETIKAPLHPMGTLHRGRAPIRLNFGLILGIVAVLIFGVAILKMISSATKKDETVAPTEVHVVDSLSVTEQAQGAAIGNAGAAIGTPATATQPTANNGVLDFWLTQPTDIKVTDATGTTLMTGQQNRGGYQLSGKPPFTVEISNPAQVDLNFNKNPVDLTKHTSGNKATLTLQ